jgi:hypothetical protein
MKTIKQFTNAAGHIDAGLIRAVIRQMGGFESFKESAQDIYITTALTAVLTGLFITLILLHSTAVIAR